MATPTPQDLTAQLQKAQIALNQKTGKATPLPSLATPTISADALGAPITPAKITPPTTPTQGIGLAGEIQTQTDAFTKGLSEKRKTAEAGMTTAGTDYQKFLNALRGETSLTAEAYEQKGGVDEIQKELDTINQQILSEQVGLQRQIERIEKNPQGMLAGALQHMILSQLRQCSS